MHLWLKWDNEILVTTQSELLKAAEGKTLTKISGLLDQVQKEKEAAEEMDNEVLLLQRITKW